MWGEALASSHVTVAVSLSRSTQIREEFAHTLLELCRNVANVQPEPGAFVQALLLRNLPKPGDVARYKQLDVE